MEASPWGNDPLRLQTRLEQLREIRELVKDRDGKAAMKELRIVSSLVAEDVCQVAVNDACWPPLKDQRTEPPRRGTLSEDGVAAELTRLLCEVLRYWPAAPEAELAALRTSVGSALDPNTSCRAWICCARRDLFAAHLLVKWFRSDLDHANDSLHNANQGVRYATMLVELLAVFGGVMWLLDWEALAVNPLPAAVASLLARGLRIRVTRIERELSQGLATSGLDRGL
jgi:hypothetical protein